MSICVITWPAESTWYVISMDSKKKIVVEFEMRRGPPIGYTVVDIQYHKLLLISCPWWAYPFVRPYYWARYKKYDIYRWLNGKGIMNTPEGEIMTWRDLKFIKRGKMK